MFQKIFKLKKSVFLRCYRKCIKHVKMKSVKTVNILFLMQMKASIKV